AEGGNAAYFVADLGLETERNRVLSWVQSYPLFGLVNNAGFGFTGRFLDQPEARLLAMLNLNIVALTDLTFRLLPGLLERGNGFVMNIGSVAGFVGVPFFAAYAATKAFVNSLSEGLSVELRGTGVHVIGIAPGKTESEFFDVAGMRGSNFLRQNVMSAERAAQLSLNALDKRKTLVVLGFRNQLSIWAAEFCPRWVTRMTLSWLYAEYRQKRPRDNSDA
ncbi:MAG: SDR family NAD(P)-dependent oxidoreductase, partial [Acidobacteria bacterium]|nr:SDR family NAD(P)-dependent oxidoreductase [Acidobacteriota bacterium]